MNNVLAESFFIGFVFGIIPGMAIGETLRVICNPAAPHHVFATGDIRSQAHFGLYRAHTIRGGFELQRYRANRNVEHKENAIAHLEKAQAAYRNYAAQLDALYDKGHFVRRYVFEMKLPKK
jgi:hypothetical protein